MSITLSPRDKDRISNRTHAPVGPEEVRCAACGTVIPEDDYPHDCGDPGPDGQRDGGAHHIGPSFVPYHGNDPSHM